MTTHPHYRFRYADPTFCKSCGGDTLPLIRYPSGQRLHGLLAALRDL
jgi:hypothetical protein